MPMYSYQCDRCGAVEDQLRCIADRDKHGPCYRCSGGRMEQIVTGAPMALVRNPAVQPGKPWRKS